MNPRPLEPNAADFPHRIVETLRFADTDRNGHITSSVFAICCQSGRLALLSDPARGVTPPASQFVLARLKLEYRREMHWPGSVEIGTRIEHIGRSSIILAQALFQNDRCAATAQSVAVLMDAASRRSLPIPPASAHHLQSFVRMARSANGGSRFTSAFPDRSACDHASAIRAPDDL
jgi:acyl-CoA thioester hydrolase